jgi:hypothetical protein
MPPPPLPRAAPWLVATLLAGLGVAAWWDQRVAFDDAFISYRYAANWVAGNGLVFNPGERVEGFSNPLWVAVAAAAIAAGSDPFNVTRALGVASYAIVLALLGFVLTRAAAPLGLRAAWLLPALGVLLLPFGLAGSAGSGLASSFVTLCLTALGVSLCLPAPGSRRLRAAAAIAAVWTRMDAVLGVVACAFVAWRASPTRRELAVSLGPPTLALAALFAARRLYYGEWLPNPYYAKGADGWHLAAGLDYLATFAWSVWPVVPLGLLGLLAVFARRSSVEPPLRRAAGWALLCVALYALYIARVGGDFMQYRFAWQVYPLLAGAGLLGLIELARRSLPAAALVAVGLAAVSLRPPVLESDYGMQSLAEMNAYAERGSEVGRQLAERLPAGTVIATTLAGTVSYYSGLEVVDQWGLNDREIARGPGLEHFKRGHYKPAAPEYLRGRGVELVLNHPTICPCDDLCVEPVAMLFVRLDAERCLQGFLLQPQDELLRRACSEPQHFVPRGVDCAAVLARAVGPES